MSNQPRDINEESTTGAVSDKGKLQARVAIVDEGHHANGIVVTCAASDESPRIDSSERTRHH